MAREYSQQKQGRTDLKILFVNHINKHTPKPLLSEYMKQHRVFVTSVIAKQPDAICSLINGDAKEAIFIDGLKRLREVKKNYDCPIFYLDNDCIMMNPIEEMYQKFDVGVIYRYKKVENGGNQDCLGGFLLFSGEHPEVEDKFLGWLIDRTQLWYERELADGKEPWYYDQLAINDLVGRPPTERNQANYLLATDYKPCVKNVDGIRVLFLSANVWACPMTMYVPSNVKFIHYNHAIWPTKFKENADRKPILRGEIQSAQAVS